MFSTLYRISFAFNGAGERGQCHSRLGIMLTDLC